MRTLNLTCKQCPFSRALEGERLVCERDDRVVRSRWKATHDCIDAVEGDERGSGRIGRIVSAIALNHNSFADELHQGEFELGIRDGLLRAGLREFHQDSPYHMGYALGLEH